jgi:lipopolysaccharide/colanic/teichoic acid biosynthesis glycosyltransferase
MSSGIPRQAEAIIALVALLIALPLILALGVLIITTSTGPALFRQKRVGRKGRQFVLYKLRTMRVLNGGAQVTSRDDRRVTPIGALLRRAKLDELPELWNIVKGDMSLVGPRPEVPCFVNLQSGLWNSVLEARPGLTDPITLELRNEETLLSKVQGSREAFYLNVLQPYKLNGYLEYFKVRSCWSDLKVIWKTLVVVVFPTKAPVLRLSDEVVEGLEVNDRGSY